MFSLRPPSTGDTKPLLEIDLKNGILGNLIGDRSFWRKASLRAFFLALLAHSRKNQTDNSLVIILARVNLLHFSCTCLSRKSSSCWNSRPTASPQRHCWRLLGSSSKLRNARTQNGCRATEMFRFSSKEPRTESTSAAKRSKKRWKRKKSATCSRPTTPSSKTSLSIF